MRGAFVEFANRDSEKGDVIDLVAYLLTNGSPGFKSKPARKQAMDWIADLCGLARMPAAQRAAAADAARRRQRQAENDAAAREGKRERAVRMFAGGLDPLGTVVDQYLAGRGIALGKLRHPERDLRFLPRAEYWMERRRDSQGRTAEHGRFFPAMIAAMRDAGGLLRAVHLTYLDPLGG
jgi:hypothetical protein